MPRTLPWLKDSATTQSKPSSTRAPKRQRIQNPASDSDTSTPASSAILKRNASTRADRTPSTSPPPSLPLPQTEPMHSGLSHDDIYIMVEDEFLSTARLYTQHLHQAEYMRLKRLAATKSSTLNPIVRPVDSITKMREETKRRKEAEKHAAKVGAGLGKMMGGGKDVEGKKMEAQGSYEDIEDEARMDAPGIGTVLGDLMMTGPRTGMGGLSGLHGVKSSTRAAAGFGKMDGQGKRVLELKGSGRGVEKVLDVEAEEEETSDDDDLDRPVVRRSTNQVPPSNTHGISLTKPPPLKPSSSSLSRPPATFKPSFSTSFTNPPKINKTPSEPSISHSKLLPRPPTSAPPARPYKPPDDEGFTRPSNPHTDAIRRKMQARREKEQEERKVKKERTIDVDEIPIFLV